MHRTNAGEKRAALKREAATLRRDAKAAMAASHVLPGAGREAIRLDARAEELYDESELLREAARLEDLRLWRMEKVKDTKKGSQTYLYWVASWREGGRVRNVHLGSCKKVSESEALEKARRLKAAALGISTRM